MRIWSLHPKYLDTKGLVALWREALLAKKVLEGDTLGYKNHPQLDRFKASKNPEASINFYLKQVYLEAVERSYIFNPFLYKEIEEVELIDVTKGQLKYEEKHLIGKLKVRDQGRYRKVKKLTNFELNPLFNLIEGRIEPWEKT